MQAIPDPYGYLLALQDARNHRWDDRTMTVKANSAGWVVSKTVRDREGVVDAVKVLDFTHGSTGSPPIDDTPDTFDDRGARPGGWVADPRDGACGLRQASPSSMALGRCPDDFS